MVSGDATMGTTPAAGGLGAPAIVEVAPQRAAVVHVTVPRAQIRAVMGPAIGEVLATIAAQGIAAGGPWFVHHLRTDPAVFDLHVGVPIDGPLAATGRVVAATLPGGRVARAEHVGPYEGLGAAWGALNAWVRAGGHVAGAELWEVYAVGPESGRDAAVWRTQLNRPLAG